MKTTRHIHPTFHVQRFLPGGQSLCVGILSASLLTFELGCAIRRTSGFTQINAPPISQQVLANLGKVGIISTSSVPKLSIQRPLSKDNAMLAARADSEKIWAHCHDNMVGWFGFNDWNIEGLATIFITPIVLPKSLIEQTVGGIKGVPATKLERSDLALTKLAGEVDLQEALRAKVSQQARTLSDSPLVVVEKPFPPGAEREFSRMSCVMAGTLAWLPNGQSPEYYLTSRGIDTALEIELVYPVLKASGIINPSMAFNAEVRARLVQVRGGKELYACSMNYRSAEKKFTEWASNDAEPLRKEIENFCEQATAQIIDRLSIPTWSAPKPMNLVSSFDE